jgi:hypothetical protein
MEGGDSEAMSIVELPPVQPVNNNEVSEQPAVADAADEISRGVSPVKKRDHKEKGKRKLSETSSMVDPDLVPKRATGAVAKSSTPVPVVTPAPMETNDDNIYERATPKSPGQERVTPKSGRKRKEAASTPVNEIIEPPALVPEMTPEVQRKPPKPKLRGAEDDSAAATTETKQQQIKRRISRKERNVKTPDPSLAGGEEEHLRPADRPMTPRQARAPSPEDRPLVVPLPPPRILDIPLPTLRPVEAEKPPYLPPRPVSALLPPPPPQPEQKVVPPPPPPRPLPPKPTEPEIFSEPITTPTVDIDKAAQQEADKMRHRQLVEEARFNQQIEATIPPELVKVNVLTQPVHEVEPLILNQPVLAQAKEAIRNSGLIMQSVEVRKPAVQDAPPKETAKPIIQLDTKVSGEGVVKPLNPPKPSITIEFGSNMTEAKLEELVATMDYSKRLNLLQGLKSLSRQEQVQDIQEIVKPMEPQQQMLVGSVKPEQVPIMQPEVVKKQIEKEDKTLSLAKAQVTSTVGQLPGAKITLAAAETGNEFHAAAALSKAAVVTTDDQQSRLLDEPAQNAQVKKLVRPQEIINIHVTAKKTIEQDQVNEVQKNGQAQQQAPPPSSLALSNRDHSPTKPITIPSSQQSAIREVTPDPGKKGDDGNRSLINSLPKPFKPNNSANIPNNQQKNVEEVQEDLPAEEPKQILRKNSTVESVASVVSELSSSNDGSNLSSNVQNGNLSASEYKSQQDQAPTAVTGSKSNQLEKDRLATQSPHPKTLQRPEKRDNRDSKVIKAAQYWNNYIGEVLDKKKPPENVKSLEKPKKITSAGVGPKGYNDLKSAFEHARLAKTDEQTTTTTNFPGMQRRNSRKLTIDGCTPGLKVNDAKSVFELKNQPPTTPVIFRRNSSMSGEGKSPKGKESDEATCSGPTYVKKMVPEFPPPPPPSKTPFGMNRKSGALSPKPLSPSEAPAKPPTLTVLQNGVVDDPQQKGKPIQIKVEVNSDNKAVDVKSVASPATNGHVSSKKAASTPEQKKETVPLKNGGLTLEPVNALKETKTKITIPENTTKIAPPKAEPPKVAAGPVLTLNKLPPTESLSGPSGLSLNTKTSSAIILENRLMEERETESKLAAVGIISKEVFKGERKQTENLANKVNNDSFREVTSEPTSKQPVSKNPKPEEAPKILGTAKSSHKKVSVVVKTATEEVPVATVIDVRTENGGKVTGPAAPRPKTPTTPTNSPAVTSKEVHHSKEKPAPLRIIPIQIEQGSKGKDEASEYERPVSVTSPTPQTPGSTSRQEHHIPIHVEGRGPIVNNLDSHSMMLDDQGESRDSFSTNSLSRRRLGSRKKRMSSSYSEPLSSTALTAEEEAALVDDDTFSGLQKYTSIGKHGMEPMFKLRKTRPPFAAQKSDSFSSGEEDDFDDDGFREMTAENLFSTLLTRVKSLTRRIHDEHDDYRFQQNHGIVNHRLNPGSTHARLERSALRNSLKRTNSNTASSALSRQSSMDASRASGFRDEYGGGYEDGTSSVRSYGSSGVGETAGGYIQRGTNQGVDRAETDSLYSIGSLKSEGAAATRGKQQEQIMKRYELESSKQTAGSDQADSGSNVSVTSKQRLRPGYLPPPSHLSSDSNDPPHPDTRIEHALSESSSVRSMGPSIRQIPISVEMGLGSSTSLASGPSQSDVYETMSEGGRIDQDSGYKRMSRFLRPDFYDTPREQSVFARMKDLEEENRKMKSSPYLKLVQARKHSSAGVSSAAELEEDKSSASTSSGYQSQQPRQHPDAVPQKFKGKEGQLPTPAKPLMFEREHTLPSTTTSASFTASNSSSVDSNLNVDPPPTLSQPIMIPKSSSVLSKPKSTPVLSQPKSSHVFSPPMSPTPQPMSPTHQPMSPTHQPLSPIFPKASQPPLTLTSPPKTSQPMSPTFHKASQPILVQPRRPSLNQPINSPPYTFSLPSSPPPSPSLLTKSPPPPFEQQPLSPTKLKPVNKPIYTPFKKIFSSPSGGDTSDSTSPATNKSTNPFQKQVRSQPIRPYLQVALIQDRIHKSQILKSKDSETSDSNPEMVVDNGKGSNRRTILPYGGAKSDGLLNKHAFISCNVIAAAERRKRDSYSRSSTTELPLEKVMIQL